MRIQYETIMLCLGFLLTTRPVDRRTIVRAPTARLSRTLSLRPNWVRLDLR
jgi:hypothetical protein